VADNKYKVSKEFLDAWSKNSAEKLAAAKAKVDAYSAAYSTASKLVDDYVKATPGDAAAKTLFASQYTPTGPGISFDRSGTPLVELTNKIKDWNGSLLPTKELKSKSNANEYYTELQALIAKSPDDIFISDSQRIRAKVLSTLPDFKGDLDEDALSALDLEKIQTTRILPDNILLTEYNAFNKSTPTTSPSGPVNEAKPAEPAPTTSPINAAEKGEKPKAASTLNPEKESATPVEATTGTVTTAKPEVPKEVTPVKPETGPTVNVTVAPTQPTAPSAEPTPTAPATQSAPTPPAASPINAEAKKEEKVGGVNNTFLTKLLGKENVEKLASNSSALNENKASSAIEKSKETIQSTTSTNELNKETNTSSVTSTTSTLNPADVAKAKPKMDMTALTRLLGKDNVDKLTNTTSEKISSSVVNETKKVDEITKSAESIAAGETGKIGGVTAELGAPTLPKETKTSTEITKTAPTLPAAPKPAEKKAELEKTQPMTASKPDAVSLTESKETKGEAASESMGPAAAAQGASATTNVDFSGVESRLARIEMLLSGPLDVKIIES
jgi:hypothetical protein